MINLDDFTNDDVLLQFKHSVYHIAHESGKGFVPIVHPAPEKQDPVPIRGDVLQGRLTKLAGGTFVLQVKNFGNTRSDILVSIDPTEVMHAYKLTTIEVFASVKSAVGNPAQA